MANKDGQTRQNYLNHYDQHNTFLQASEHAVVTNIRSTIHEHKVNTTSISVWGKNKGKTLVVGGWEDRTNLLSLALLHQAVDLLLQSTVLGVPPG